jgi:hypothetical protein
MALEHASLTGSQVHEPKGVQTAPSGTVYVSDGAGSGDWSDPLVSLYSKNLFQITERFDDLAAPGSLYFNVPYKSKLKRLNVILYGTLDTNTLLSIYIGGVLFADSLTLVAAGSSAGQRQHVVITTTNTIPAETRSHCLSGRMKKTCTP